MREYYAVLLTISVVLLAIAIIYNLILLTPLGGPHRRVTGALLNITLINSTTYYVMYAGNTNLSRGVIVNGVEFLRLPTTMTGCRGDEFLVLFPDGSSEVLRVIYACPFMKSEGVVLSLSTHEVPRAGILYSNYKLYLLVSKYNLSNLELKAIYRSYGDWIVGLLIPTRKACRNVTLKLIYVGREEALNPYGSDCIIMLGCGGSNLIIRTNFLEGVNSLSPGTTYTVNLNLSRSVEGGPLTLSLHCEYPVVKEGSVVKFKQLDAHISLYLIVNSYSK